MTESHPDYFPELKLGDEVQSKHFTGMVCCVEGKFYIIGTKNEGFAGAARYATAVGEPWCYESYESLKKLAARWKIPGFKILKKVEN